MSRAIPVYGDALSALKEWAGEKGLEVNSTSGTQREPENVVYIKVPGTFTSLVRGVSQDSVETAAIYVVNTLQRLGAW